MVCVHFRSMSQTITIRVSDDLAAWLEDTAVKSGVSRGKIVREHLEKARATAGNQDFMRLAGSMKGPKGLSSRKGFARAGSKKPLLNAIKRLGEGDGQPVGRHHNEFLYGRKRA